MKKLFLLPLFLLPLPSLASSVSEIASSSLVAFWEFEEDSGVRYDSFADYDLNDNNTVLASSSGKIGKAADFESDNSEYLSRAVNDSALNLQDSFTVAFWFKFERNPSTFAYSPSFIGKGVTNSGYTLRTSYADGKANWVKNDAVTYDSTTSFVAGTWYFISVTFNGSLIKVYVNGTEQSSTSYTNHNTNNGYFNVGRESVYFRYFDGLIDELGIWHTALSSSTINALYNGGSGIPFIGSVENSSTTSILPVVLSNDMMPLASTSCVVNGTATVCSYMYAASTTFGVAPSIFVELSIIFVASVLAAFFLTKHFL